MKRLFPSICFGVLLLLQFGILPQAVVSAPSIWKNVVIEGEGFVTGLALYPTTSEVFYTRTDVDGAFHWQELSWLSVSNHLRKHDEQLT